VLLGRDVPFLVYDIRDHTVLSCVIGNAKFDHLAKISVRFFCCVVTITPFVISKYLFGADTLRICLYCTSFNFCSLFRLAHDGGSKLGASHLPPGALPLEPCSQNLLY
jgi:hypothetical protein